MNVIWNRTTIVRGGFAGLALFFSATSVLGAHAGAAQATSAQQGAPSSLWAPLSGAQGHSCGIVLYGPGAAGAAVAANDLNTYLVANGVITLRPSDLQPLDALALGGDRSPAASLADLQALLAQVQAHPACSSLVLTYAGPASPGSLSFAPASQPTTLSYAALAALLQPLAHLGVRLTLLLDAPTPAHAVDAFAGFGLQGTLIASPSPASFSRSLVLAAARPFGQDAAASLVVAATRHGLLATPFSPTPLAPLTPVSPVVPVTPAAPATVLDAFTARSGSVNVLGTYTLLTPSDTACGAAPAAYTATLALRMVDGMFLLLVPSDDNAINPGTLNADGSFSTAREGETYAGTIDANGVGSATNTYGYDSCSWTYHVTFAAA